MPHPIRAVAAALALLLAPCARAGVQILMTVEGPRGPFVTADAEAPNALRVTSARVDFGPSTSAPLLAPRPVVVVRPLDAQSWQFLDAVAANDTLRVVITISRAPAADGSEPPGPEASGVRRRVVTLTGARILSVHAGADATAEPRAALGVETISFTYRRIEVEDDGTRVFISGA